MSRNREMLRRVAVALAGVPGEIVFVGGTVVDLLVTDEAAPAPRVTGDVDVVIEAATWGDYTVLTERLRGRGFREDAREGAPTCRWLLDDLVVDIMPAPFDRLGFANRWYARAFEFADVHDIGDCVSIRVPVAPLLLAMKWEAFRSKTRGDVRESRDVEDIVALLDGRAGIIAEVASAPAEVRTFVRECAAGLLADPQVTEVIAGHLPGDPASQGRAVVVLDRLRLLSG